MDYQSIGASHASRSLSIGSSIIWPSAALLTARRLWPAKVPITAKGMPKWVRVLLTASRWSGEISNRYRDGVSAKQAAVCESSRHRQLEEFFDLKLRHSREARGEESGPLDGQLRSARHALEEAQLNYDHAREDVRLDCYHQRDQA